MFGVCLPHSTDGMVRNQWDYVLSHFVPEKVWIIGGEPHENYRYLKPEFIATAEGLPADRPLVILAPAAGKYVQGNQSLLDFQHPENAIYLFGPDNRHLSEDELGTVVEDHLVFIPTDTHHEMYSWVAGALTFYDRKVKAHG